tara:strand:+ start:38 stop:439 length:402 start_codon:yes stop_codon:yes gene_type:complete
MKLTKLGIGMICVFSLFLFGCGLQEAGTTTSAGVSQQMQLQAGEASDNSATYNIKMSDNFIEPDRIKVKRGTPVEFLVTYSGNNTNKFAVDGYSIEERLVEGKTVSVSFRADKEGIFGFGDFKRPLGEIVVLK